MRKNKSILWASLLGKFIVSLKVGSIVMLCSAIIAIPTTILTLPQSMVMAESLYRDVSEWLHLTSPARITMDDDGIPIVDYGYKGQTYVGPQRNPLAVASAAIEYYNKFKETGDSKYEKYFKNCINWLDASKISKINMGDWYLWAYNFADASYGVSAPFYSALAQYRIMLAFERAYELTKDKQYLELADKVLYSLSVPIKSGGVMYRDSDSAGNWYAEVASPERDKPPFILNGHMEVLQGLRESHLLTGSKQALDLFQDGVAELKRVLPYYDTGRWSYYDREGHLAFDYHYTHVEELGYLYEVTGEAIFREYRDRWASYFPLNPMWARKRFAAYLLNLVISFLVLAGSTTAFLIIRSHRRQRMGTYQIAKSGSKSEAR